MNVALSERNVNERNVYENFDIDSDVLYFKTGVQGLVSFHGRNYNRKRRMTADEIQKLVSQPNFYQVSSNCYINLSKITSIQDGTIYFGTALSDAKRLTVNRRKQYVIEQLFTQRAKG